MNGQQSTFELPDAGRQAAGDDFGAFRNVDAAQHDDGITAD
jgi:hypothetical protein